MAHDFDGHAKRRCEIVKANFPDSYKGELLVRMNKLIKRNNQSYVAGNYDKAEIKEIKNLLEWTKNNPVQ